MHIFKTQATHLILKFLQTATVNKSFVCLILLSWWLSFFAVKAETTRLFEAAVSFIKRLLTLAFFSSLGKCIPDHRHRLGTHISMHAHCARASRTIFSSCCSSLRNLILCNFDVFFPVRRRRFLDICPPRTADFEKVPITP